MNKRLQYPLADIIEIKERRVEDAEKFVLQKEKELEAEKDKLKKCEEARDKVLAHHNDKLQQLRNTLDAGTTSDKIQQMKRYLNLVKENLEKEEEKVKKQEEAVEKSKQNLLDAKEQLKQRRKEVDKIENHKDLWIKERKKEIEIEDQRLEDEVSELTFINRKRRNESLEN